MQVQLEWADSSQEWINHLPQFSDRMFGEIVRGLRPVADRLMDVARAHMPEFEGTMAADLHVLSLQRVSRRDAEVTVGWTLGGATVMPAVESLDRATAPFHYPWGVHSGVRAHRVWYWSYRSSRARAKLIRWAKANIGLPQDVSETAASPEAIEEAADPFPPFLYVHHDPRLFFVSGLDAAQGAVRRLVKHALEEAW